MVDWHLIEYTKETYSRNLLCRENNFYFTHTTFYFLFFIFYFPEMSMWTFFLQLYVGEDRTSI